MKKFNKIAAFLLALLMLLSITVLPAFAEGEEEDTMTTTSAEGTESSVETVDGTGDVPEIDMENLDFTDTAETEEKSDESGNGSEEISTTGSEGTSEDVAAAPATTAEKKGLSTNAIVWIVVGSVVLIAAVVLCIVFRKRVGKFLRVYKSEVKKIVWLPWDQTKKSTLVVLVILIICATAICLVDLGLSKGFLAFLKLFQK